MTLVVTTQGHGERAIALHADAAIGVTPDNEEIIVSAPGRYVIEIMGWQPGGDELGALGAIELDRDQFIKFIAAGCKHWVDNIEM